MDWEAQHDRLMKTAILALESGDTDTVQAALGIP